MTRKSASSNKSAKAPQQDILQDYLLAYKSRQASLLGRKEVLTGKAKFGIFGDGKEVAQIALAKAFQRGDWRSGYYRDQTILMALGELSLKQFFAQLFADPQLEREPASGGRQMNNHFASRFLDAESQWLSQIDAFNTSSDISPTAGQMARLVGLGYASKLYRENSRLKNAPLFSREGNEVAFGTIGNASTSEGVFWEAMNAIGVLQLPVVMSVWDDDYGISVHNRYQTTKGSISKIMRGFAPDQENNCGIAIHVVKGWDYSALIDVYQRAAEEARQLHRPSLIHVVEISQPQGHSTSGSHERYKSKERLAYEEGIDCLHKMRQWILQEGVSDEKKLTALEAEAKTEVDQAKAAAWQEYLAPIEEERQEVLQLLNAGDENEALQTLARDLGRSPSLHRRLVESALAKALVLPTLGDEMRQSISAYLAHYRAKNLQLYRSHLLSESAHSPMQAQHVAPEYASDAAKVDGRQVIQKFFDLAIAADPRIFIIGEDIGKLGGVNLEFEGLQERHGELHVTDTGIREATILGQGIGAALRGLRPVVDIQYLDYVLYCFQAMSDDLATLRYRTAGGQAAPVIVRTKGHRLEGIWHTGSPMGVLLNGLRGMHVCVPRNMVQAAGFYRTLLQGDDPALVIEVLNGYRVKELLPDNMEHYQLPLGVPEILQEGTDLTLVTYGACVRVAEEAISLLKSREVSVELIDVQTLLPFDIHGIIVKSLAKTNAILFLDEDVPGGASAFMYNQVLEVQQGFDLLEIAPRTVAAAASRSAYGSDGDYYSKPSAEEVFFVAYEMMRGRDSHRFPEIL